MSHDAVDDTQGEENLEVPLTVLGLIGALARAMEDHQKAVIQPKKDAPRNPLVQSFTDDKRTDLVIEIGGEKVGHYKVNTTKPKFVVDDEAAFDSYAEEKGEIEVVIVRRKSFETAVLSHAQRDPETGLIVDSRNGEIVPGLKFVPGGKPTGTVTWTWETFKKRPVGKDVLMAAYRRGELNEVLRDVPELLPGAVPEATDA